jgi:uncharacterized protein (TIRG00374 family)
MVSKKQSTKLPKFKFNKKIVIYFIIFALFAYFIIPRWADLTTGLQAARTANLRWLIYALIASLGTYVSATSIFLLLSRQRLKFWLTFYIQLAASFVNKLIPSGVGAIGVNIVYLKKIGISGANAASIMTMNSSVAFLGYMILTLVVVVNNTHIIDKYITNVHLPIIMYFVIFGVIVIFSAVLIKWKSMRQKITKFLIETWQELLEYRKTPVRLTISLLLAMAITIFFCSALYFCVRSLDLNASFAQIFIVYTIGLIFGAALPTPGGLGGVDAGLFAGLLGLGFDSGQAFSAVILFRLITFWLPILPGYVCFWQLQKKKYI